MAIHRFKSEGPVDYGQYRFGYCEWLELGRNDPLSRAYEHGFLPYSAESGDPRDRFYMARSLRIDLEQFSISKERRYDHRAWLAFSPGRRHVSKAEFMTGPGIRALEQARTWMSNRFGKAFLDPDRLRYILGKPFLQDILTWHLGKDLVAFALVVRGRWGAHYWYVFYRNGVAETSPPGHGYLVDFLEWAREESLPRAYLGTAYGSKSLYKSRGLGGVEFWDGNAWCADKGRLKRLQESD